MKSLEIQTKKRENVGKSSSNMLRNTGFVPCVIYGDDKPAVHIAVEKKQFKPLVYTHEVYQVALSIDNEKPIDVLLQEVQYHPVTDEILHADFIILQSNKQASVEVPVVTKGNSPGVIKGGKLRLVNRKIKVKAIPAELPDKLEVDISSMEIGNKMYVKAFRDQKFEILHPDNMVLVDIKISRTAIKTAQAEEKKKK